MTSMVGMALGPFAMMTWAGHTDSGARPAWRAGLAASVQARWCLGPSTQGAVVTSPTRGLSRAGPPSGPRAVAWAVPRLLRDVTETGTRDRQSHGSPVVRTVRSSALFAPPLPPPCGPRLQNNCDRRWGEARPVQDGGVTLGQLLRIRGTHLPQTMLLYSVPFLP